MVSPGNHELGVGQLRRDYVEGLDHQFKALVRSPFSESQNAMLGITSAGEIRKFRPAREYAVSAQVNIVAPIFVVQDLAIAGHQHGDGIRKQEHAGSHGACDAIQTFVSNAHIFQFDSVHQVMQRDVSVSAAQPGE
jgi:hypothetical protein